MIQTESASRPHSGSPASPSPTRAPFPLTPRVGVDEGKDLVVQVLTGGEVAAAQHPTGQDRDLHVQPAGVNGCVGHGEAWMVDQPEPGLFGGVAGTVVQDEVDLLCRVHGRRQLGEELGECRRVVGDDDLGVDAAVGDVHRSHERDGGVPDVFELAQLGTTTAHRPGGPLAALGLHRGLFVHAEQHRVGRLRLQVQGTHSLGFGDERGVRPGRFMLAPGTTWDSDTLLDLLKRIAGSYRWMHVEKLDQVDGQPGFTRAQGEN